MSKPFKTIEEQVALLRKRGLNIKDEGLAQQFLLENNYYRVSGYSLTLRKGDKFYPNATFEKLIQIYECDQEVRNTILKMTEGIEVKIKSLFAYYFCESCNPLEYDDVTKYSDADEFDRIFKKTEELKNNWKIHEKFLQHFEEINEKPPFWAYVDLFTLSNISKLYQIFIDKDIKIKIANNFGYPSIKPFENAIHSISIIRNMCAHGVRLYNKIFIRKPDLSREEKELLRNINGEKDYSHLFSYILIIKRLVSKHQFEEFKSTMIKLKNTFNSVNFVNHYGFNPLWETLL